MKQGFKFYEDYKDLDTADLMSKLDECGIESEQDYGNEITTWTFADNSAIKIHNMRITIIEDDSFIDVSNLSLRSHTEKEIKQALRNGEEIWALDTDKFGEDDVLIGEEGQVLYDVLNHHELEALPQNWSITALRGYIKKELK